MYAVDSTSEEINSDSSPAIEIKKLVHKRSSITKKVPTSFFKYFTDYKDSTDVDCRGGDF